jgi:hypothetical protein
LRQLPLHDFVFLAVTGLLVVHCVLGLSGCSSQGKLKPKPTFPVTGRVLLGDRPVVDALVVFHPLDSEGAEPVRSYARTQADGGFEVSTYKENDGVPPGRYAITVMKINEEDGSHLLPPRYASPKTSGLQVNITEGVNRIAPIRLVR